MKKKLLISQNASLFAEVERKGGEIRTLEIKLEDSKKQNGVLEKQISGLEGQITELTAEVEELKAIIKELRDELEARPVTPPDIKDEITPEPEGLTLAQPTPVEENPPAEILNPAEIILEPEASEGKAALPTETETVTKEMLREKGLWAIGEVTKSVAKALANLPDDETSSTGKSLIMGKNEGFKYEVFSVLETETPKNQDIQKILNLKTNIENFLENVNSI